MPAANSSGSVASQCQVVLVLARDHATRGKLNFLLSIFALVLHRDIHIPKLGEEVLQDV